MDRAVGVPCRPQAESDGRLATSTTTTTLAMDDAMAITAAMPLESTTTTTNAAVVCRGGYRGRDKLGCVVFLGVERDSTRFTVAVVVFIGVFSGMVHRHVRHGDGGGTVDRVVRTTPHRGRRSTCCTCLSVVCCDWV